jgi:hypothetical protein
MFNSEFRLHCMCLCGSQRRTGVTYLEEPEKTGKYVREEETMMRSRIKCDILAKERVCEIEFKETFQRTAALGSDGLYPCCQSLGPTMIRDVPTLISHIYPFQSCMCTYLGQVLRCF